jgi:tryptophan 2,3-dioxygenase
LEFALGLKRKPSLLHYPEASEARRRLEARYDQPALWDYFLEFLVREGYRVPPDLLNRDVTRPVRPSPELQQILVEIYREKPLITELCENLVDFDEGFQEWRYRHVKMVERTIGAKRGTGGSVGVEYLKTTLFQPVFPDLWAIRTQL